jgi:hypothetical protein
MSYRRSIMSYKSLTEIMDSLPPERRARVEARAKQLKEEYPVAAEVIRWSKSGSNSKPASPTLRKN